MARSKVNGASRCIYKRNLIYHLVYPFVKAQFRYYYGEVEVKGLENIPRNAPVIFSPNHQNALMDALIVLFFAPGDVVFLARADIFNKPVLAYLLNSLKILPVFRQRDGQAELSKNQEIFDISVEVLKNRHYLCIMPEGNHGDKRKLRPIVKGIFRIAFKAQEDEGSRPFVKIVPVGLDFGDYVKQNASLFVNFGKAIEVSDYWELYQENNAKGINAVKKELIDGLKPQMIHIETDAYYEAVQELRQIFNPRMREIMGIEGKRLSDRFRADQEMIARMDELIVSDPEKVKPLAENIINYVKGVKAMKIRDWVVREEGYKPMRSCWRYLTLLLTFPVFLYGFLTNAVPFFLPVRFVRGIKDRQFHASVKAALAMLLVFPLYHIVQTLIVGFFTGPWWIWVAFLFTLFPIGRAALFWSFRWKKTVKGRMFARKLRRGDAVATGLVKQRREIVEQTEALIA
ncbi:MAG: hypothetical protein CSA96_09435 [Bacteroidetes bacterium]|nr:MAG: hypothetical protein CSA96_09435 [Bacteroidota bacterium]